MQPNTRKLALVLSLGMALSACGDGDGSSAAPESSVTTKAAPANTSASEATPSTAAATQDSAAAQNGTNAQDAANAQDVAGTQNTTGTQNTAAAQDTATAATQNDAAASGTDNTTAAATPAETSTTDAIRTTDDGKSYEIRGDLLIQILLSRVPHKDAANEPMLDWIDPDKSYTTRLVLGDTLHDKMIGPVLLVQEDITPNPDNAAADKYLYRFSVDTGPTRGPLQGKDVETGETTRPDIRIGLSQAGMPRDEASPPVSSPLEISKQVTVAPTRPAVKFLPDSAEEQTLTRKEASIIDPKSWYPLHWEHTWHGDRNKTYESITWAVYRTKDSPSQLDICVIFEIAYNAHEQLCERREIPDGWTSGQPLKHVRWNTQTDFFSELGDSISYWLWNDSKGASSISRSDLKTTSEPISKRGISGAVLAALLDAYTPRAGGMDALPKRAGGADDVYSSKSKENDPAFVSLRHESLATAYADGSSNGSGYSPAAGPYLYTLNAGTWQSDAEPHSPGKELPGLALTVSLQNDAQKGVILPRLTGLTLQKRDENDKIVQSYQGDLNSENSTDKTIAPNDLIPFGSHVQTWNDPDTESSIPRNKASVWLTVEQSLEDERSVDLCWNFYGPTTIAKTNYCTTTSIPEGWAAGQPLLPQSYYAVFGGYSYKRKFWNTRIAH